MRVPLSWLREFVDVDLSPERLADRLTLLGMEVSAIERIGDDWQRVVVGELLEVAPHPNSGRLSLTRVRIGEGEAELSIVCGATNIAAGQRVPVALPGSVLPGDRRIEVTTIAGVPSQGMLCSGDELGLSSDADGILILPADDDRGPRPGRAGRRRRPGRGRQAQPRRRPLHPRAGPRGRGRDRVAVALAGPLGRRSRATARADHLAVEVEEPDLCPRFVGRFVEGVQCRPLALARAAAPHLGWHAAHLQRRGCLQLRAPGAGEAHPHLRCGCHPRGPHRGASGEARRAAGDARSRRPRADDGDTAHRRCARDRWPSPASWAAPPARSATRRATSSSSRPSSTRSASAARRSERHSAARPACASRRARSTPWPSPGPTGQPPSCCAGPGDGWPWAWWTVSRWVRHPTRITFRPARVEPPAG